MSYILVMYRVDGRCGEGYKNDGTNMPAMCDPTSSTPCCSRDNHCTADCDCYQCIDYSNGRFISKVFYSLD